MQFTNNIISLKSKSGLIKRVTGFGILSLINWTDNNACLKAWYLAWFKQGIIWMGMNIWFSNRNWSVVFCSIEFDLQLTLRKVKRGEKSIKQFKIIEGS